MYTKHALLQFAGKLAISAHNVILSNTYKLSENIKDLDKTLAEYNKAIMENANESHSKSMNNEPITIPMQISSCNDCPHAQVSKVYTSDPFENVRQIYCQALGKKVYYGLDWNEKANIPSECVYRKDE
jgi:hypothetical protein